MDWSAELKADLSRDGYCILPSVLTRESARSLREQVLGLAAAENRNSTAWHSNGNQRVFALLNKGREFVSIAEHPIALDVVESLLGSYALLSSITAHVVRPGNVEQQLHADQDYVSPPWPRALVINLIWALDSFTSENGATMILPGSHRAGTPPVEVARTKYPEVRVRANPGSVVVLDGRVWHGSGRNTQEASDRVAILACYCAPFLRQQENFFRSLETPVRHALSGRMRRLLGYEVWNGLGVVGGLPPAWSTRSRRSGLDNSDGAFPADIEGLDDIAE